ncbi:MAG: TRAP transporter fused permease subunit [Rhodospirillales bacterium]|nr:TRAP transporter fused permease subunit [Rhodospirillales bacterium]
MSEEKIGLVPAGEEGRYANRLSHPVLGPLVAVVATLTTVVHIYFNSIGLISELRFAAIHFGLFGLLCALLYPARKQSKTTNLGVVFDITLGAMTLFCGIYFLFNDTAYWDRGGEMSSFDWYVAITAIVLALEMLRRAMGWMIPLLIIIALSYAAYWGKHIDGVFRFPGISFDELLARAYFVDLGLFGDIAQISMTYVFMFVLFGSFLVKSGSAEFIINLARAVARKAIGGSGIVAVLGSALMGSISGSAVANVVTTGVITIPLMKRSGFSPRFAAGVEAAASTGGQLLPPIMGAGAFVMASYTQISYLTIAAMALLPALLYFASVLFFVRMGAIKHNLDEYEDAEAPVLSKVLKEGWFTLMPIGVLVVFLVIGYTATYAAAGAILATIVLSWFSRKNRMGPKQILEAMIDGSRNAASTAILLVSIGLFVGILGTTGFGAVFSLMIIDWSGGSLIVMLVLITLVSLVLGMGLPVTAGYIVLATISAPSLADLITSNNFAELLMNGQVPDGARAILQMINPEFSKMLEAGISSEQASQIIANLPIEIRAVLRPMVLSPELIASSLLSAHMIIFWISQDSNVTPPVCLPAFAAAAIAGSPPMRTGLTAFGLCKGLYIVPLLFAFTPILGGNWLEMMEVFVFALIGMHALCAAMTGVVERAVALWMRIPLGALGIFLLWSFEVEYKVVPALIYLVFVFADWNAREKSAAGIKE